MSDLTILGIVEIVIGASLIAYAVYRERRYRSGEGAFIVGAVTVIWGVAAVVLGLVL